MGKDQNEQPSKYDNGERLDRELQTGFSNLWGACTIARGGGVYALYLRQKQGGVWVAVAKKALPDNPTALVAFGSGRSIGSALAALNGSISQGKWKQDMPWGGSPIE